MGVAGVRSELKRIPLSANRLAVRDTFYCVGSASLLRIQRNLLHVVSFTSPQFDCKLRYILNYIDDRGFLVET